MKKTNEFNLEWFCKKYKLDIYEASRLLKVALPKVKKFKTYDEAKSIYLQAASIPNQLNASSAMMLLASTFEEMRDFFKTLSQKNKQNSYTREVFTAAERKFEAFYKQRVLETESIEDLKKMFFDKSIGIYSRVDVLLIDKIINLSNTAKELDAAFKMIDEVDEQDVKRAVSALYSKTLKKLAALHGYKPKKLPRKKN